SQARVISSPMMKLKVKALMWLAGKYNRKVFGDSQQIEVTDTRPVINLPAQFQGFGLPVIEGEISDVEPEGKDEDKL
ncbi:hypothetical protein, partial [Sphingobium sp. Ant17]|uniref:hypothetical protein n=1 Tax=Sphingobium sp. Ant17 TaxID=1461752 RepID=UPI001F2EB35D